jgi:hypothetical protein
MQSVPTTLRRAYAGQHKQASLLPPVAGGNKSPAFFIPKAAFRHSLTAKDQLQRVMHTVSLPSIDDERQQQHATKPPKGHNAIFKFLFLMLFLFCLVAYYLFILYHGSSGQAMTTTTTASHVIRPVRKEDMLIILEDLTAGSAHLHAHRLIYNESQWQYKETYQSSHYESMSDFYKATISESRLFAPHYYDDKRTATEKEDDHEEENVFHYGKQWVKTDTRKYNVLVLTKSMSRASVLNSAFSANLPPHDVVSVTSNIMGDRELALLFWLGLPLVARNSGDIVRFDDVDGHAYRVPLAVLASQWQAVQCWSDFLQWTGTHFATVTSTGHHLLHSLVPTAWVRPHLLYQANTHAHRVFPSMARRIERTQQWFWSKMGSDVGPTETGSSCNWTCLDDDDDNDMVCLSRCLNSYNLLAPEKVDDTCQTVYVQRLVGTWQLVGQTIGSLRDDKSTQPLYLAFRSLGYRDCTTLHWLHDMPQALSHSWTVAAATLHQCE